MPPNIVAKYPQHRRFADVEDWRPLLRYSAGNPLTLTIFVRHVIGFGTTTRSGIDHFIDQLKAGGTGIEDEGEGRTASLSASLNYGLQQAFTDTDRARLAVLHLFHDTIDFRSLGFVGELTDDANDPLVPELAGATREDCIRLLDRAAEIGILTREGGPYYTIHPPCRGTAVALHQSLPPDVRIPRPNPRAVRHSRLYDHGGDRRLLLGEG